MNCCGFSAVFADILCIEIRPAFSSDLSCWGQIYQCWYFSFICLALVCDEIFFLPLLRLYVGVWGTMKAKFSPGIKAEEDLESPYTAQKWESGRPQPAPNCHPEFLFITCCFRTHFGITYLKYTQQNTWEKKISELKGYMNDQEKVTEE